MVAQDDVQQLATQCREVEKLLELPVGVVHALLSGEEQSADLDTLMEWLVRAKELSSRNVQLADSLLGAGQQLNHDAKGTCTHPPCRRFCNCNPLLQPCAVRSSMVNPTCAESSLVATHAQ